MKYWWIAKNESHLQKETTASLGNILKNMEPSMHITIRPTRKPKRVRSAFTTEQISFLEQQFKRFPYISSEHRKEIATALNLQERAIKIWFQNRRMKEKKESCNKEPNYETTNQLDGHDRLINARTLTSANEPLSYSLPIIVKPFDRSTIKVSKPNTDKKRNRNQDETKMQQVPQNLSLKHTKTPIKMNLDKTLTSPFMMQRVSTQQRLMNYNPPNTKKSTEIDFSKKLKKEINHLVNPDLKRKVQRNLASGHPKTTARIRSGPEDLSSNKSRAPQMPSKPPKKTKLSGSPYYPVIPTVYGHPYISSGGMIWKPVNVMPVMSAGTTMNIPNNLQQNFGHGQKTNCSCNCHENAQPFTVPPNPISPYAQYVITAPFPNPSSKFE